MFKLILLYVLSLHFLYAQCYDKNTFKNNDIAKTFQCLQNEVNELKSSATIVKVNYVNGLKKPSISQSQTLKDFRFDLQVCNKIGNQIICKITLTNTNNKDLNFYYNDVKVYDEKNKMYERGIETYIVDKRGLQTRQIISKVPTPTTIKINNFDKDSTILTALKINTAVGKVEFRDIAIK